MARRQRGVRVMVGEVEGEEKSTSEEEEEEDEEEAEEEEVKVAARRSAGRGKINISLRNAKLCKVCKSDQHVAGFMGSVYVDCPNKPCYLCKQPGHTTATCPHRIAPEHGATPAVRRQSGSLLEVVQQRELRGVRGTVKRMGVIPNRVDAAVVKLHSRRVSALEFHPTKDNIVISGDKKGQVGVWDFQKVFEKTVYSNIHHYLISSIRFHAEDDVNVYTSSLDGKICLSDLETGFEETLVDINPHGWQGDLATWRSFYAMDVNSERGLVLAGDDIGNLHRLDARAKKPLTGAEFIHKKGTKVTSLHCNPANPDLFVSGGNDHMAHIWDSRRLDSKESLAALPHPRVVNSAYFSPLSGQKLLTTCQDNRLRVWDYLYDDLSEASREIVHSHDFNRYLTAFRAEWDPKDPTESLIVCGRYISDDYNGVALHPVDFIDSTTGALVAAVFDPNLTTICPVNKPHPRLDLMVTGSSRSLFVWRPAEEEEEDQKKQSEAGPSERTIRIQIYDADEGGGRKGGRGKKKGGDSDDDDDEPKKKVAGKGSKALKVETGTKNATGKGEEKTYGPNRRVMEVVVQDVGKKAKAGNGDPVQGKKRGRRRGTEEDEDDGEGDGSGEEADRGEGRVVPKRGSGKAREEGPDKEDVKGETSRQKQKKGATAGKQETGTSEKNMQTQRRQTRRSVQGSAQAVAGEREGSKVAQKGRGRGKKVEAAESGSEDDAEEDDESGVEEGGSDDDYKPRKSAK